MRFQLQEWEPRLDARPGLLLRPAGSALTSKSENQRASERNKAQPSEAIETSRDAFDTPRDRWLNVRISEWLTHGYPATAANLSKIIVIRRSARRDSTGSPLGAFVIRPADTLICLAAYSRGAVKRDPVGLNRQHSFAGEIEPANAQPLANGNWAFSDGPPRAGSFGSIATSAAGPELAKH
jgi:hypothetical protein